MLVLYMFATYVLHGDAMNTCMMCGGRQKHRKGCPRGDE